MATMRIARPVTRTETDAAGDQGAAPQNVEVDDATPPVATPLVDVLPFSATRRGYLGNLGQFGSYKKKPGSAGRAPPSEGSARNMMTNRPSWSKPRLLVLAVLGLVAAYGCRAEAADFENGIYQTEFRFTGTGQGESLVRIREATFATEVIDGKIKHQWVQMGPSFRARISGEIIGDYAKITMLVRCIIWVDRDIRFEGPIRDGRFHDQGETFTSGFSGPFIGTLKMTYVASR